MRRALLTSAPLRPQPQLLLRRRRQRLHLAARAAAPASQRLLPLPQQHHHPMIPPQPQQRRALATAPKPPSPTTAAAAAASDAPPTDAPAVDPTAAATKREPGPEEEGEGEEVAFPWRVAPPQASSFWQLVAKAFREFMPQAYLRGLFFNAVGNTMETPPEDVPELLFRCTRFAFIQAIRGIFEEAGTTPQPLPSTSSRPSSSGGAVDEEAAAEAAGAGAAAVVTCLTPPPTWDYTSEENVARASGEHELGYPPLSEMMDAQLAALYEGSVARLQARGRSVRLELEKVEPVSITDLQLVIGPPRGAPMPPGATKHNRLGVTVVASKPPEDDQQGQGGQTAGPNGGGSGDWGQSFLAQIRPRLVPNYHYLFQMAVTFRCRELFSVTHAETGALLQGWDEPREVEHCVRFEVDFDKHAQLSREWRIIDIDGWLGGNEYLAGVANDGGDASGSVAGGGPGPGRRDDE